MIDKPSQNGSVYYWLANTIAHLPTNRRLFPRELFLVMFVQSVLKSRQSSQWLAMTNTISGLWGREGLPAAGFLRWFWREEGRPVGAESIGRCDSTPVFRDPPDPCQVFFERFNAQSPPLPVVSMKALWDSHRSRLICGYNVLYWHHPQSSQWQIESRTAAPCESRSHSHWCHWV